MSQAIYFAQDIVRSSANKVTITYGSPALHPDIRIMEYTNVDRTNPFSTGSSTAGEAGPANSGAVTTTAAPQLLVGAGMTQQAYLGAGARYTIRMLTSPDGDLVEDRVVTSPGTYEATAKLKGNWLMQLAAFRAAL
jgi:hypothetical protein